MPITATVENIVHAGVSKNALQTMYTVKYKLRTRFVDV